MQPGQTYVRRLTPRVTIRTEGSSTVPKGNFQGQVCKRKKSGARAERLQRGARGRERETERKTKRQRETDVKENLSTKALNLDKLMDVRLIVRLLACPGRRRHGG